MTKKSVDIYNNKGKKLPKTCSECKKALREVIEVGKCKYCGKSIKMMRLEYEQKTKQDSLILCCEKCIPIMKKEQDNRVFIEKECFVCNKKFSITFREKKFYEKKGWKIPNRCEECRKKGRR